MGVKEYLSGRKAVSASQAAAAISEAIKDLSAARLGAMQLHDACVAAQSSETPEVRGAMEQTAQTLGAIVRELSNAVQAAREAQAAYDQLERVETHLNTNYGPK